MTDEIITNILDALESYYVVGDDNIEGLDGLTQNALTTLGQVETATLSDNITPIQSGIGKKTIIAKLRLIENGSPINDVIVISSTGLDPTSSIVDANLTTGAGDNNLTSHTGVFDFGDNISRSATVLFGGSARSGGNHQATNTVEVSEDNISYVTVFSATTNYPVQGSPQVATPNVITPTSVFRYVRITQTTGVDNFGNPTVRMSVFEVYDTAFPINGGTGHTINIRASNTIDTADGIILKTVIVNPESSFTIDEFLVVPSGKFLTFELFSFGTARRRSVLANEIITEEFTGN